MGEYISFEIEDLGIFFRYPEWWEHRVEENGTYLFWDEYVGSFRITPTRSKQAGFSLTNYLEQALTTHPSAKKRKIGKREFVCSQQDNPDGKGGTTRLHVYTGGEDKVFLVCSFAYNTRLLEDEFSQEGVEAALEEVEILLEGLRFGEEDE